MPHLTSSSNMTLEEIVGIPGAQYILASDPRRSHQLFRIAVMLFWICVRSRMLGILRALSVATGIWSLIGIYRSWAVESPGVWNALQKKLLLILWHFEGEPLSMRLLAVAGMVYTIFLIDRLITMQHRVEIVVEVEEEAVGQEQEVED
jgi:hypothetical protein